MEKGLEGVRRRREFLSNHSTGILFDIIGAKSSGSDYFQQ